jgi:PAS domain S-box-containing protein
LEKALGEIHQRTEALRRSEGYLAEAQKLTHTGSWVWNVRTGVLFWSQEIFRIYDYDPLKIGPTWPQFLERVHPEDRPRIEQRAKMEITQKDWVDSRGDFRIVLPDGTIKHLHSIAHPVMDGSGEITEVVGTVMDVTEQWNARAALEKALEEIQRLKDRLQNENLALREQMDQALMFEEIVGASPALRAVLSRVSKVAPTDSTVLLTGETGTGKELIARAIHKRSRRSSRAFVSVNCAAIPSSLIASELFGHEKGAFTGATQRRLGRFELAEEGTLFLDEVGELPAETQITLLRVLQEREFERVGGNQPIQANVRVIAATNRDLEAAIAVGTFRGDLFYRLNVFPIEIPPLRERREDIPLLVEYFIGHFARKAGKSFRGINKKTLDLLLSYPWPGNIRELQNVVERSVIVCETENFSVDESWLSRQSLASEPKSHLELSKKLATQEKEMIEAALRESGGRVSGPSGAAAKLGIHRSTLESKIASLKIDKYRFKTASASKNS